MKYSKWLNKKHQKKIKKKCKSKIIECNDDEKPTTKPQDRKDITECWIVSNENDEQFKKIIKKSFIEFGI
jgi:uncharacterized pyridoxamine 5'-phosphate oxidase family protein